jgi:hypothetical protein
MKLVHLAMFSLSAAMLSLLAACETGEVGAFGCTEDAQCTREESCKLGSCVSRVAQTRDPDVPRRPDGPVVDDRAPADCKGTRIGEAEYFACTDERSYADAIAQCARLDAWLLDLGDGGHAEGDVSEEARVVDAAAIGEIPFWLGVDDRAEEGAFRWARGTPLDVTQARASGNFVAREPNDASEDCIAETVSGWIDVLCTDRRATICENLDRPEALPSDCTTVSVPSETYFLCRSLRTHDEALALCAGVGGKMLTYGEHSTFIAASIERTAVFTAALTSSYWVGLDDIDVEGVFQWRTEAIPLGPGFSGLFKRGEPNDPGGEDCVERRADGWRDIACTERRAFVCERR